MLVCANGFIDGARKALLINTSTLAVGRERLADQVVHLVLIGDVGADGHGAPAHAGDLLGQVVGRSTARASTRSAPAPAQRRASVVPSAGPTPLMTTTCRRVDLTSQLHHPVADLLLAQRDPRAPVLVGDLVSIRNTEAPAHFTGVDDLGSRARRPR